MNETNDDSGQKPTGLAITPEELAGLGITPIPNEHVQFTYFSLDVGSRMPYDVTMPDYNGSRLISVWIELGKVFQQAFPEKGFADGSEFDSCYARFRLLYQTAKLIADSHPVIAHMDAQAASYGGESASGYAPMFEANPTSKEQLLEVIAAARTFRKIVSESFFTGNVDSCTIACSRQIEMAMSIIKNHAQL